VNPERAELVERDQRGIVVGDQHGLGDLKLQPPRVEPGFGQRGLSDSVRDLNWIGETLMATRTCAGQLAASAQAVRSTHWPIRSPRPHESVRRR